MAITFQGKDFQVFQLLGITSGGGTATVTYPIPSNYVVLLKATVLMMASSSGLNAGAALQAEFCVSNNAGTGATLAILTLPSTGINPASSNTVGFIGAVAQGSDIDSGSPTDPTAVWSRSTTNAVLTITNVYVSAVDAVVYLEIYPAKNV